MILLEKSNLRIFVLRTQFPSVVKYVSVKVCSNIFPKGRVVVIKPPELQRVRVGWVVVCPN